MRSSAIFFRQSRHQHPFVPVGPRTNLTDQVVDLSLGGFDDNLRIEKAGGTDHLLDESATGLAEFIRAGGGRQI